jgi:hypothetical protein
MVADMPLDNRTVDQIAADAASFGPTGRLKPLPQHERSKISSRLIVL